MAQRDFSISAICVLSVAAAFFAITAGDSAGICAEEVASKGILSTEFIYENAPFPECHASTLVETKDGFIVAWFGGTEEQNPDVGIWLSRRGKDGWSAPVEVATGVDPADAKKRQPCWNPVLYQSPDGPLVLFYKVGPSPSTWWGMMIQSQDHGKTWSPPHRFPNDIFGPIKNKPVRLNDGRLLCGTSTEDHGWRVHMEWTNDLGKTWTRTEALNNGTTLQAIQPTILKHGVDKLQILCRGKGTNRIVESWSDDNGATWTPMKLTDLPNPNSGIDAVTLKNGRHVLIYNHTERGRSPLNIASSIDGKKWMAGPVLEDQPGEYSYPAIIQSADGMVHVTYTWKRKKIKHVVIDPAKVEWKDL